jgi:adenine-specific DNA-methyltransferase
MASAKLEINELTRTRTRIPVALQSAFEQAVRGYSRHLHRRPCHSGRSRHKPSPRVARKGCGPRARRVRQWRPEQLIDQLARLQRALGNFRGQLSDGETGKAARVRIPMKAFDLQHYSSVLAGAVLSRQTKLDWGEVWRDWHRRAILLFEANRVPPISKITQAVVADCRGWSQSQASLTLTKAYGGHYFSPEQAVWIDSLRDSLPANEPTRTVALAALIQAASQCAAAPGHTAQPFQPTRTAKRFLAEAWSRDIVAKTHVAFQTLAGTFSRHRGQAEIADANHAARQLRVGDLVFIDPPYSGVHYSRFYHVLETIARGGCGEVSGVGRYPAPELRPRSRYSVSSESNEALDDLLKTIAERGARAILTFPDHDCSNGLSGEKVHELAMKYFSVFMQPVESKFSTLGGTSGETRAGEAGRAARKHTKELMLVLRPKKAKPPSNFRTCGG